MNGHRARMLGVGIVAGCVGVLATAGTSFAEGEIGKGGIVRLQGGGQSRIGPQGPAGQNGVKGEQGEQAEQGAQGAQGEQGEQGAQGAHGPMGPMGPMGPAGLHGAKGERGAAGPMGPAGPAGLHGAKGERGAPGAPGIAGSMGPKGERGAPGPAGLNGERGQRGMDGAAGQKGERGFQGAAGTSGILNVRIVSASRVAELGQRTIIGEALCDVSEVVLSGGFSVSENTQTIKVTQSAPLEAAHAQSNGWIAGVALEGIAGKGQSITLTTFAVCAELSTR